MRTGIRFQLTSVSVGVALVTALALTATLTVILRRTLASQLTERTSHVAAVLEGQLSLRRSDVEHASDILAGNDQFALHMNNEAWPDITTELQEIRTKRKIDVAVVFDHEGTMQASSGADLKGQAAAFGAAHVRADLPKERPQSLIEPIGGKLYVVSAQRVSYYGNQRGELVLASEINDAVAAAIQKQIGAQVIAFTSDGPKASSTPLGKPVTDALQATWKEIAPHKLVSLGSIKLADVSHYAMAFGLSPKPIANDKPEGPSTVGFAYGVPETEMVLAQRRTFTGALALSLVVSIIGVVLGLMLANQIARPITAMADQFSRISASGDLSLRVDEASTNEIGDMARSFNAMQERVEQLHGRVVQAEERMRKELQMASTVQEMLFQQEMPHNRACDVAAYTSTLVETSGDWYAVFDDPDAKRTIFVIADATGHGASAALLTAITHGFFQTMWTARQGSDSALSRIAPSQILSMLNSVVLNSAHGTITATVFVGVLHHGTRKMVYASAGHIPPIVTRWTNNEMKANILSCNPSSSIGSAEKPVYEDYTVELPADSLVMMYTDGLTEVENHAGLQWGVRKLIGVLRGCQTDTVESVRQKVLDSVMAFAKGKELQDDMTYLTVRIL